MNSVFQAKYLQHLNSKKGEKGFTLIELLVVIIIIGILAAIALPAFLNQANKAKQSEAKTTVGSMNRAQQAYQLEKNQFSSSDAKGFGELGLGVKTQSTNYKYQIEDGGAAGTGVTNQGRPAVTTAPIKAYVGGVNLGLVTATSEATTLVVLCEADAAVGVKQALTGAQKATYDKDKGPQCPTDYSEVK
jgi:type IV pilus assembly protein PilA